MQVGEVSNGAVHDPLHPSKSTAVLKLNAQRCVSVAFLLAGLVSVGNRNLELLEEDRNSFVTVLVALEHTGQEEGRRSTSQQLGHQLSGLCMVDLPLCLGSVAQQLEAVLDGLPLLGAQTRRAFTAHAPRWSTFAGWIALFSIRVVSAQSTIGQASRTVQASRPGALLVAQAGASLVF